ncbi:EthD domain-containing protein [Aspergillus falconensis]
METGKNYLCLNILGFKNPSVSAQEYYDYMVNVHAPHVGGLLAKYGIVHWSMTHADVNSPAQFDKIRDGLFSNYAPFDVCVTLVMPDIETWIRFKADEFFKQSVGPDHARFADTKRSQMMLGWYTPLIKDGQLTINTLNHHNPQTEL